MEGQGKTMMRENNVDIVRGSLELADYRQPVMTLLFLEIK
jgi:hypothetical protein